MRVDTRPLFERHYRKLSRQIKERAKAKELLFRADPFHPSLDTHKLHVKDNEAWAFSIDRKYRIKFLFLSDSHALFLDVGTHDIYE
jgi:mRNA-degrading endonuclease YafQ of YafQ-DinJ toxin-antitoxin module